MSAFWWGVLIVAGLWVFFTIRSRKKAARSFNAIDGADPWLESQDIDPNSVRFSTYEEPALARNLGAMVIVGWGKTKQGDDKAFAIEIKRGAGVVTGEIIVPYGIATWHKNASMQAKLTKQPLIDVLLSMAAQHRSRHSAEPVAKIEVNFLPTAPDITRGTTVLKWHAGRYGVLLVEGAPTIASRIMEQPLPVDYTYPFTLVAIDANTGTPALFITLEESSMTEGAFLGAFDSQGKHHNYGPRPDLKDRVAFIQVAGQMMEGSLKTPLVPTEK